MLPAAADGAVDDARADTSKPVVPPVGCAALIDAGVDGGKVVFCDDFENKAAVADGWMGKAERGGTLELSVLRVASGAKSLRVAVGGGDAGAVNKTAFLISKDLAPAGLPLYVSFELLVETLPASTGNATEGFVFGKHVSLAGSLPFSAGVSAPNQFNPFLLPSEPIAYLGLLAWQHVVFRVDSGPCTLDVTPRAGGPTLRRTRSDISPTGSGQTLFLGVETSPAGGPVTLFIDDVVIYH